MSGIAAADVLDDALAVVRGEVARLRSEVASLRSASKPYGGRPAIAGLTQIKPGIALSRASGTTPCAIHASASPITADAGEPYLDLEYRWSFGDAAPAWLYNPADNRPADAGRDQTGPEAAYLYRTPGTYAITLTARGRDGQGRTIEASTTATVTVSAWTGETRYFDSNAAAGGDGSEARPWSTTAELTAWMAKDTSHRRARLKAGSVFSGPPWPWWRVNGARIEAYGAGPKPVLDMIWQWSTTYGGDISDIAISGIEIRGALSGYNSVNGDRAKPYGDGHTFTFDGCTFKFAPGIIFAKADRFLFWNNEFVGTPSDNGALLSCREWAAFVGGSFSGGVGDLNLGHHLYPTIRGHSLYRWVDFLPGHRSFAINTNANHEGAPTPYVLIDGCSVRGTRHGFDLSNKANDPKYGRFDLVVVQGNAICPDLPGGFLGSGIYSECLDRAAIRDNRIWGYSGWAIALKDPGTRASIYRNRICRTVPGAPVPTLMLAAPADQVDNETN